MDSSEEYRSIIQNLSFGYASNAVDKQFGRGTFGSLKIRTRDGTYNNFALLLSDQCPWSFVIVSDHYGELYRCNGSILKQINDVMRVTDSINPKLHIKGRTGYIRRFPRMALEEGILNAAIHFDISPVMDITINIGREKLVIISPGGMIEPKRRNMKYTSSPRNNNLAELLKSMGKVNLKFYGTRCINDSYQRTGQRPILRMSGNFFLTYCPSVADEIRDESHITRRISDILANHPGSTLAGLSERMLLSPSVTLRAVTKMESDDTVFEMGSNSDKRFYLSEIRKPRQVTMPGTSYDRLFDDER